MGKLMINLAWSALTRGDFTLWETAPYARRTTTSILKFDGPAYKLSALVPYGDNLLRAHLIEQLVQLVLGSSLRDRLLELDSLNTYEKVNLIYPVPGQYVGSLPSGVSLTSVYEDSVFYDQGSGDLKYEITIDPTSLEVVVDGGNPVDYSSNNNLTSPIEIVPGLSIRLKGDLGVTPFTFLVNYVADPSVAWREVLARVKRTNWGWEDTELRDIAEQDPLWTNQLSAYVVSAVEDNLRG